MKERLKKKVKQNINLYDFGLKILKKQAISIIKINIFKKQ